MSPNQCSGICLFHVAVLVLLPVLMAWANPALAETDPCNGPEWNMDLLRQPPRVYATDLYPEPGVTAVFYEALPWQGNPTRVFAYYGLPEGASSETPVPAMVLAHGGGGTAYAEWVRLWNQRGYAAIAMDTDGSLPDGVFPNRPRHEYSGPPATAFGFDQADWPLADQWYYHMVADVILAHTFLAALPEVDADRIGLMGISWGAIKAGIVAGLDSRFRGVIMVYGCGFLDGEGSAMATRILNYGHDNWMAWWDPSSYLPRARMPMLWMDGTNDTHFPLSIVGQSARASAASVTYFTTILEMPHSHPAGWSPPESFACADGLFRNEWPLPRVVQQCRDQGVAWAAYAPTTLQEAELVYTTDSGTWVDRQWQTVAATVTPGRNRVEAALPAGTTAYYFNLIDERGLRGCGVMVEP